MICEFSLLSSSQISHGRNERDDTACSVFCIVLVAGGGGRHPDQVHPGRLMHVVLSHHHQHVHDVVRVEDQVQLAREPLLRDIKSAYIDSEDGEEVLEDDMAGGVWRPPSVGTEPEAETDHPDDEGGGEGKAAAPDG